LFAFILEKAVQTQRRKGRKEDQIFIGRASITILVRRASQDFPLPTFVFSSRLCVETPFLGSSDVTASQFAWRDPSCLRAFPHGVAVL
jgi:hypothetical protein